MGFINFVWCHTHTLYRVRTFSVYGYIYWVDSIVYCSINYRICLHVFFFFVRMFLFYFIKKTTFLVNSESIIFGIENNVCFGFIVLDLFGMKGFIFKVDYMFLFSFLFIYLENFILGL